ncbi:MAG: cysteine desulfurase family protein [Deltaproteobacteria bacterium]|nr:cysteine desulfurase family protein [Deltaproteobacteria bacterium]
MRVYLDHNATTPLGAAARSAVQAALDVWGNPSSIHTQGRQARSLVEDARLHVARLLGCEPDEVIFVSGGTEGDNLAIRGLALWARDERKAALAGAKPHVISTAIEHPAVRGAMAELVREGFELTELPVSSDGLVAPESLAAALRPTTLVVSIALANHEIGTIAPIAALAKLAHEAGAYFHTDAVQAAGKMRIDVRSLGVDAATISSHKLYGPKGAGAIYVRRGLWAHPLVAGGHQEHERRGGTENTLAIAGFGAACLETLATIDDDGARIAALRDTLESKLLQLPLAHRHGPADPQARVPGTTNVRFDGARGELVVIGLDLEGICVSTGAACTSGSVEPSAVLLGIGVPVARAREAIRFSLGRNTTLDDIHVTVAAVERVVARIRAVPK